MTMPVSTDGGFDPRKGTQGGQKTYANQVSSAVNRINYASLRPKTKPRVLTIGSGGVPALPTASATQIDVCTFPDNLIELELYQNTAQTLLPRLVVGSESNGLEIGLDLVDNETVEYVVGGNHLANPYAYTVGTSKPAFFRCTIKLADGSGTDNLGIGWRKVQAYAAATDPIFLAATDPIYTDFCFLGIAAAAADNPTLRTVTDVANSGVPVVTSTGFTWADGKTHCLEIRLSGTHAFYYINGVKLGSGPITVDGLGAALTSQTPLAQPSVTFTAADVFVPFIFNRFATTSPAVIYIVPNGTYPGIEVGPLSEIGLDNNNLEK